MPRHDPVQLGAAGSVFTFGNPAPENFQPVTVKAANPQRSYDLTLPLSFNAPSKMGTSTVLPSRFDIVASHAPGYELPGSLFAAPASRSMNASQPPPGRSSQPKPPGIGCPSRPLQSR